MSVSTSCVPANVLSSAVHVHMGSNTSAGRNCRDSGRVRPILPFLFYLLLYHTHLKHRRAHMKVLYQITFNGENYLKMQESFVVVFCT